MLPTGDPSYGRNLTTIRVPPDCRSTGPSSSPEGTTTNTHTPYYYVVVTPVTSPGDRVNLSINIVLLQWSTESSVPADWINSPLLSADNNVKTTTPYSMICGLSVRIFCQAVQHQRPITTLQIKCNCSSDFAINEANKSAQGLLDSLRRCDGRSL